jgi:hypothetical protein
MYNSNAFEKFSKTDMKIRKLCFNPPNSNIITLKSILIKVGLCNIGYIQGHSPKKVWIWTYCL